MCAVESHQFSPWHLASTKAFSHPIHCLGDKRRLTPGSHGSSEFKPPKAGVVLGG